MSKCSLSFVFGAVLQGIVLGVGLLLAIAELSSSEIGAQVFRYQGF